MINKYDFFYKFQVPLLKLINHPLGRKYFGISHECQEKILKITPNSYAIQVGKNKYRETFRCYDLFGKKLELAIKVGSLLSISSFLPQLAPVIALTTDSIFVGAGDGYCEIGNTTDWNAIHDATDSTTVDSTATTLQCGIDSTDSGPKLFFKRAFLPVDTSSLVDNAIISAASLKIYATGVSDNDNDGNDYICVVQTTQASNTTLANADYDQCGSVDNPTQAGNIDLGSITTSAYNTWTLNATGQGWISKTGFTKLGIREGHDAVDNPINLGDFQGCKLTASTSEASGTTQDPYLEVTYTVPEGGFIFIGA